MLALAVSLSAGGIVPQQAEAAISCSRLSTQRKTTDAPTTTKRVLFVYLVPRDGTDERLDIPSACSDGSFRASTIGRMYTDISVWMAKALSSTLGSRRLVTARQTYRNPYTGGTRPLTTAVVVRSPENSATWNCKSPTKKLESIRNLLISKGMANPNTVYATILQGKQTCTSVSTAGAGYFGTVGSGFGHAYVLRSFWNGGSTYVKARFGCANYTGDAVMAHEVLHVLGGVPKAAPNSDGGGHIRTDHDVLEALLDGPFATSRGGTRLQFDSGVTDYRRTVLGKGYDVPGVSPSTAYRMC